MDGAAQRQDGTQEVIRFDRLALVDAGGIRDVLLKAGGFVDTPGEGSLVYRQ